MLSQQQQKTIETEFDGKKRINAGKMCEKHGVKYEEVSFDRYACVACISDEKKRAAFQNKVREAKSRLALPVKLEKYTFSSFKESQENKEALDKCRRYVDLWPNVGGILMLGGVGTGKTHLAVAICKELCEKALYCHITTTNKMIRKVRSSWGKNPTTDEWGETLTEDDIISKYASYDLLVIDEIGAQYGSDGERIIINEIINDRYEMERPTIIIGNVSYSEAEKILGARVVDRIKDNGNVLFFEWESHRRMT